MEFTLKCDLNQWNWSSPEQLKSWMNIMIFTNLLGKPDLYCRIPNYKSKSIWILNFGNCGRTEALWGDVRACQECREDQKEEQKWLIILWIIQLGIYRKLIWWFDPFIFTVSFNYYWFCFFFFYFVFFLSMLENRINGMISILLPVLVPYLTLHILLFYFPSEGTL